jgi:hypothetical protein
MPYSGRRFARGEESAFGPGLGRTDIPVCLSEPEGEELVTEH